MADQTEKSTDSRWAYYITIGIVVFAAHLVLLVVLAARQDMSLVRKDYYAAELAYQEQINSSSRTAALENKPLIVYDSDQRLISVRMNQEDKDAAGIEDIMLLLYRPSNAELDTTISLKLSKDGAAVVDVSGLADGFWRARLNWRQSDLKYYKASSFFKRGG